MLPHNPRRRIVYMRGDVYFQPTPGRFARLKIKPDVVDFALEDDPLARLIATAKKRGMQVRAWTNGTHSTMQASQASGLRSPECVRRRLHHDIVSSQSGCTSLLVRAQR